MYIKYEKRKSNKGENRTYVSIIEGYRDIDGIVRQRRIKSFGYIEVHPDKEVFLAMVKEELAVLEAEADNKFDLSITAEENTNDADFNVIYNYGYRYLESIYDELKIEDFLNTFQRESGGKDKYNYNDVFKLLVLERILNPDSKRAAVQSIGRYYNSNFDFSLDDVYRFLPKFASTFDEYQAHLRRGVDSIFKTNKDRLYYDVTNYYFEIDFDDEDGYRKRGVSKEHRVDPIIGMSLFMDASGLPLKFNIFSGNTAESTTLVSEIKKVKADYNVKRTVIIADKGLNTTKNITEIVQNGDGFLFSQILRGKKGRRYQEKMFEEDGYVHTYNDAGTVVHKHKLYNEEYEIVIDGKVETKTRKVLIYYELKDDLKMKRKRSEKIKKAEKSLGNKAYTIDHSFKKYMEETLSDKTTGEVLENVQVDKYIDEEKINEDEKFDGYFCLLTSELEYSYEKIRETYHHLSEIEDTFRVTKSDLEFRPIYHFKSENIKAHFLICYSALLIIRLLQFKLIQDGISLSVERIVRVLNSMNLETFKTIVHLHRIGGKLDYKRLDKNNEIRFSNRFDGSDELKKDYELIKLSFDTPFNYAFARIEKFNKYFKNIKFHTTTA